MPSHLHAVLLLFWCGVSWHLLFVSGAYTHCLSHRVHRSLLLLLLRLSPLDWVAAAVAYLVQHQGHRVGFRCEDPSPLNPWLFKGGVLDCLLWAGACVFGCYCYYHQAGHSGRGSGFTWF
jgi:hypothetical protein